MIKYLQYVQYHFQNLAIPSLFFNHNSHNPQIAPVTFQHILLRNRTRGSAIAERPARRSVSAEILLYCCTNNVNRSHVSLRSTFSNCHVLFCCMHSFVHAFVTLGTASMQCRARHQQTPVQPILLMSTGP